MQSNQIQVILNEAGVEELCQSCGACCSTYRVSFYWGETTASAFGTVPEEMTQQLSPSRSCMKGTSQSNPRCCALTGQVGERVSCSIYEVRSSTCREYDVFDADGNLNPRCNESRVKHGLPELNVKFVRTAVLEGPALPV